MEKGEEKQQTFSVTTTHTKNIFIYLMFCKKKNGNKIIFRPTPSVPT